MQLPFHHEDQVIFYSKAFNKTPTEGATEEELLATAKAQLGVIRSEVNEVTKACFEKDFDDLRDAIADVQVTLYGLPYLLGYGRLTSAFFQGATENPPVFIASSLAEHVLASAHSSMLTMSGRFGLASRPETLNWETIAETFDILVETHIYTLERTVNRGQVPTEDAVRDVSLTALTNIITMAGALAIPVSNDFNEVMRKLMTRLCTSQEQAEETVAAYKEQGLDAFIEPSPIEGYYSVRTDLTPEIQTDKNGEEFPAGKVLKSVGYELPVFGTLVSPYVILSSEEALGEAAAEDNLIDAPPEVEAPALIDGEGAEIVTE